jgi:sugar phosphate isomerase/epimerase
MRQILASNDRLSVCFDVNHLFTASHREFLRTFSDKIITVHVSDCIETDERHWMPGEGVIDWDSVMQGFKEINYKGVWMYEVRATADPNRKMPYDFSEFYKNANWLFAKMN